MLRRLLDSPWLYFGLAALLVVYVLVAWLRPVEPAGLPSGDMDDLLELGEREDLSVLLLLVDTLRADRMGSYGYARDTTPNLDALVAEGIRFAHVEAQSSWTKASMGSLWTASFPRRAGILHYADTLGPDALLPAERLREAGFRTGGIFRNGWVDSYYGFDQGFDLYLKPLPSRTREHLRRSRFAGAHKLAGSDRDLTASAREFLHTHGQERFFLYLHYMDLHQYLYETTDAGFGTTRSDAYDAALRWTDRNIAELMLALEELGLRDSTLVVLVSDHGEAFFEHGREGHGQTLHGEVTRTPLLLLPPFRLDPGVVVETPARNVDLWPTLFQLLGLPAPEGVDGRSLVPWIVAAGRGEEAPGPAEASIAELDPSWGRRRQKGWSDVALVDGPWRLIHYGDGRTPPELYDHRVDPGEQTNLAAEHPEALDALEERVRAYRETQSTWQGDPVELDAMRRQQLRALGYMVE